MMKIEKDRIICTYIQVEDIYERCTKLAGDATYSLLCNSEFITASCRETGYVWKWPTGKVRLLRYKPVNAKNENFEDNGDGTWSKKEG